jgi:protein-S-isoprenylcysteine O-methyltransferase Ste14
MFFVMFLTILYRIRMEEKALLKTFGDEYRAYIHRTWRLLPGW